MQQLLEERETRRHGMGSLKKMPRHFADLFQVHTAQHMSHQTQPVESAQESHPPVICCCAGPYPTKLHE